MEEEETAKYIEEQLKNVLKQPMHMKHFLISGKKRQFLHEASSPFIKALAGLSNATHHLTKHFAPKIHKKLRKMHGPRMQLLHETEDARDLRRHMKDQAYSEEKGQKGSGFWSSIGNAFSGAWDGVKKAASATWDGVKDAAGAVYDHVISPVIDYTAALGNKFADDPLGTIVGGGKLIFDAATGDALGGISDAADFLSLPDKKQPEQHDEQ